MTIRFKVANEPLLEPGYHEGTIYDAHEVLDPAKGGEVIKIRWNVNNYYITENLQIANPEPKKAAFFQKKLRQILAALNLPPLSSAKEGEEVSYDFSTLLGKSCGLHVIHKEYNGMTYVNIKEYVIPRPVAAKPLPENKQGKWLNDDLPF